MFGLPVSAGDYSVHSPDSYKYSSDEQEQVLFIMDFSSSMSEFIEGKRKVEMMRDAMLEILPRLSKNTSYGLRVYGNRGGFTPMDACRASTVLVPIGHGTSQAMYNSLFATKPRGMTPITYSLKQAVKYDFMGYNGKKHIILLTDGGENCDESPCTYVMELIKSRKDIKIDVIAFNIDNEDDIAQLECTSMVTSGKFYSANTTAELAKSMNSIFNIKKEVSATVMPND